MRAVLKTNDLILLNFAEALLKDAKVPCTVFDSHMSVMDGSIGALPRRLMVSDDSFDLACEVLKSAWPDMQFPQ